MNVLNANEVDTKKMVKIVNFVMYICHNKKKNNNMCTTKPKANNKKDSKRKRTALKTQQEIRAAPETSP